MPPFGAPGKRIREPKIKPARPLWLALNHIVKLLTGGAIFKGAMAADKT